MGVSGRPTRAWASENKRLLTTPVVPFQDSPAATAATAATNIMIFRDEIISLLLKVCRGSGIEDHSGRFEVVLFDMNQAKPAASSSYFDEQR
jgi:hypothetical protein